MIKLSVLIFLAFATNEATLRQLPIRGNLPLQDYENKEDIFDLENFRNNDIVFRWQTANGHYHLVKENSFIEFWRSNHVRNPHMFSCPFTRERIRWSDAHKYRLVNNPQDLGNQNQSRQYQERNHQRYQEENRRRNRQQTQQVDNEKKEKETSTW